MKFLENQMFLVSQSGLILSFFLEYLCSYSNVLSLLELLFGSTKVIDLVANYSPVGSVCSFATLDTKSRL